jgi:putative transposase
MKKVRFTETQIISILKQQEAGIPVKDLAREHGISEATFYVRVKTFNYNIYNQVNRCRTLLLNVTMAL